MKILQQIIATVVMGLLFHFMRQWWGFETAVLSALASIAGLIIMVRSDQ